METLDDTRGEFFKKCLRQKCIQKKCPWLASQPAVFFFVTLTRFQTWHKDKISLFSFNIFYFVSRLIKTWNRYRRKYCERVSFISAGPSLFSTVHEILNGWWKSFCSREPINMDSKALRALYRMSVSKGVSELRVVCFQIKHTLFTDLNKISKTSINKPHKRLWEKGNTTLLNTVLYIARSINYVHCIR